jgi:hypothetical protein
MDFCVALDFATRHRADLRLIYPDEVVMSFPNQTFSERIRLLCLSALSIKAPPAGSDLCPSRWLCASA